MMSMVTLSWIVHTGYLLQEPGQSTTSPDHTKAAMPGQDTPIETGTGKVIQGQSHIFTNIVAQVIMIDIEAAPGHDTGIIATTQE